ncbi:MAG: hypothetical protein AMXMBFR13_14890 [Phycisphaerae bacterium]
MWEGFFNPEEALRSLGLRESTQNVLEFGCGYGTFTIPAARIVCGTVFAFDIEPGMVDATSRRTHEAGLTNVCVEQRDFVAEGTGLSDGSIDYVMLFNILHCEEPLVLLGEAWRVLPEGGLLAIIHWNYDPSTPRGPSMDIRPRPEQCQEWAEQAGFRMHDPGCVDLPPFHYGLLLWKPGSGGPLA